MVSSICGENRLIVTQITVSLCRSNWRTERNSFALNLSMLRCFLIARITALGLRLIRLLWTYFRSFSTPDIVIHFISLEEPSIFFSVQIWRDLTSNIRHYNCSAFNLLVTRYRSSSPSAMPNLSSVKEYYTLSFESFSHFVFYQVGTDALLSIFEYLAHW